MLYVTYITLEIFSCANRNCYQLEKFLRLFSHFSFTPCYITRVTAIWIPFIYWYVKNCCIVRSFIKCASCLLLRNRGSIFMLCAIILGWNHTFLCCMLTGFPEEKWPGRTLCKENWMPLYAPHLIGYWKFESTRISEISGLTKLLQFLLHLPKLHI